ncbi:MAG: cysteine hydrolase [Acidobacteriota bacterium]|nr:cysteine hydrolase [Acidobacteriota bacterium]
MSSQPGKQKDMDGSAPDTNIAALLLIDVINDFEYPGGEQLLQNALPIAGCIRDLKKRARIAKIPAIYVNDNFGRWQSSFEQLLEHCTQPGVRGRGFVQPLAPEADDYFVLKPKHSAFYQTPLDVLLKHLGTKRLIVTGLCTNSCVLFTGHDAYMRDLELYVPSDCVAAVTPDDHRYALEQMQSVMKADTSPSDHLDLAALTKR